MTNPPIFHRRNAINPFVRGPARAKTNFFNRNHSLDVCPATTNPSIGNVLTSTGTPNIDLVISVLPRPRTTRNTRMPRALAAAKCPNSWAMSDNYNASCSKTTFNRKVPIKRVGGVNGQADGDDQYEDSQSHHPAEHRNKPSFPTRRANLPYANPKSSPLIKVSIWQVRFSAAIRALGGHLYPFISGVRQPSYLSLFENGP
jgi:hypothetical protein